MFQWCDVMFQWCDVSVMWCDVMFQWCDVMWCFSDVMWCFSDVMWNDVKWREMTWRDMMCQVDWCPPVLVLVQLYFCTFRLEIWQDSRHCGRCLHYLCAGTPQMSCFLFLYVLYCLDLDCPCDRCVLMLLRSLVFSCASSCGIYLLLSTTVITVIIIIIIIIIIIVVVVIVAN